MFKWPGEAPAVVRVPAQSVALFATRRLKKPTCTLDGAKLPQWGREQRYLTRADGRILSCCVFRCFSQVRLTVTGSDFRDVVFKEPRGAGMGLADSVVNGRMMMMMKLT